MSRERHIELPRTTAAAALARSALGEWFGEELEAELLEDAQLLASELVTNSYVHGEGAIELRAVLDGDRVLVEVIDQGGGFERVVKEQSIDDIGGRGLAIVDAAASRWGIHEGTTHVWFEIERPGPRLGEDAKPEP